MQYIKSAMIALILALGVFAGYKAQAEAVPVEISAEDGR